MLRDVNLSCGEEESGGDRAAQSQAVRGTGRGQSRARASSGRRKVTYGFHLVEGRMPHGREDRHVAEFRRLDDEAVRRGSKDDISCVVVRLH